MTKTSTTLENDGSVSDDPCQACDGRLMLRRAPNGGFFLGCSNFPKGCVFKMAPNSEELVANEIAKEERKLAREQKRLAADAEYAREQAEEKAAKKRFRPVYCGECSERLSVVDRQAGLLDHPRCAF